MDFFGSLAKAEQNHFSNLTMAFAGPSERNLTIGSLATALKQSGYENEGYDDENFMANVDEDGEYQEKKNFAFHRNGTRYQIRARNFCIGFQEVENGPDEPRIALLIEVRTQTHNGGNFWVEAGTAFFDRPPVIDKTAADVVYWKAAEDLLPQLEAMFKCVACGRDVFDRPEIIQPDGKRFRPQHCLSCSRYTWEEPCTNCGSHMGERAKKRLPGVPVDEKGSQWGFTGRCSHCK